MDKTNQAVEQAPGADAPVNLKEIRIAVKHDLGAAIRFLDAIYSDPDLLESVAVFMKGRLDNYRHAKALKAQQDLPLNQEK